MKFITITRRIMLTTVTIWTAVFILLSSFSINSFQILNVVGFLFLALLPGILTFMTMRLKGLSFWGTLSTIVGFSLLELMLMGLIGNTLLPHLGIIRPLDKPFILSEIFILILILTPVVWFRMEVFSFSLKKYLVFDNRKDFILAFSPIIFVVLAILGTIRLNDGGSNIFTMLMLGFSVIYLWILARHSDDLDENTIPTAIFFLAMALLFMTSLRGLYITGHDIQREYKVFELAKNNGWWNIAFYRDAYNACLSITILPTIFFNLLRVADAYIFKFFFQIFFAFCPVLVYLIGKQWAPRFLALIGVIYFISFPTFITDMPFLVRQEIAFLFFALMLYLTFETRLRISTRRILFLIMGIGIILSHYSTTYIVLVILGLACIFRPIFQRILFYLRSKLYLSDSSLNHQLDNLDKRPKISLALVGVLLFLSFMWTSVITNTGDGITNALTQTLASIEQGFGANNRSVDATTLLSFKKPDIDQIFNQYLQNVIEPIRASGSPDEYYPTSAYENYPIHALRDETAPLSKLSLLLDRFHIPVPYLMTWLGQILAKLSEVLVPLALLYVFFRKKIVDSVDIEIFLLTFFSLVFIAMTIFLPVLSTLYGIFRATQQSMFIMAPFIAIGSIVLYWGLMRAIRYFLASFKISSDHMNKFFTPISSRIFASSLAVLFFAYTSAFIPQIFGGSGALLHLNNSGTYYDNLLIQTQEVYGINWLADFSAAHPTLQNEIQFEVQSDRFSSSKLVSISSLDPLNDIFPSIVRKNAYVFLSTANINKGRASIFYSGDRLVYSYPIEFLDNNKSLVYNNGGSQVYR